MARPNMNTHCDGQRQKQETGASCQEEQCAESGENRERESHVLYQMPLSRRSELVREKQGDRVRKKRPQG